MQKSQDTLFTDFFFVKCVIGSAFSSAEAIFTTYTPLADWMGINFQWGFKGLRRSFMSVGILKNILSLACLLFMNI